ncbi:MAG: DUF4384 domain-containing protein [Deltaproteobacteria bacterium]|nr:DUF4384 domain-containing protein [Deltaproteobacteria bacterium]
MKRIVIFTLAAMLLAPGFLMANSATAISVVGKAWQKKTAQDKWTPLARGAKVDEQGWVKTDKGAMVRLISPGGGIIMVAEGQEMHLGKNAKASPSGKGRMLAVLGEVFSGDKRARMAASRAGLDGAEEQNEAAQKRLDEIYDATWAELMSKPRLSGDDMELAFDTAAWYHQQPVQNRAVALLVRLREDFPEHEGVGVFASQALADYGRPGKLEFIARKKGQEQTLKSGDTLKEGDGVNVRFQSQTENYLYVFLHTQPSSGKADTTRIFPPSEVPRWPTEASEKLELPQQGEFFTLDNTQGNEALWVWSCLAPLSDEKIDPAVQKVLQSGKFTDAKVTEAAPSLCVQGFAVSFAHR